MKALAEDESSVPLFHPCSFDVEELEFIRTVWSAILALQTEGFLSLVADMKSL